MAEQAEDIAARLRASQSLGESTAIAGAAMADPIEIRFVPARPGDGPVAKDKLLHEANAELAILQKALPDLTQRVLHVTVAGDQIDSATVIEGTLADGKNVSATRRATYTLHDGKIAVMTVHVDAATTATLQALYRAGGINPR